MKIIWDEQKYRALLIERGIDLEEIRDKILSKDFYEIRQSLTRPNQLVFLMKYKNYTHVVPFILDKDSNIVIKTVFPSRKFHKKAGGNHEKN